MTTDVPSADPTADKRELLLGHFEPLVQPTDEQMHVLDLLAEILTLPYVALLGELIEDVRARAEERAVNAFITEVEAKLKATEDTD